MNKRFYSIYYLCLLLLTACSNDEIQTYNGTNGINLFVLVNQKQVSTAQVPLGFMDESISDSTIFLIANVVGKTSTTDRIVELDVPDSLTAANNTVFEFPRQITLPAGQYSVQFPLKVKRAPLDSYSNGLNIVIRLKPNGDFSNGVSSYATITATNSMPTQWIGYTYWFPYYFGTCTKTKYRFVYATLGFYDFTSVGYNMNALGVYRNYLNNKLDEYEQIHGIRLWDPDLNKNVTFP